MVASSAPHRPARESLDTDDVFNAVANSRRRQVILSVDRSTGGVSVGALAVKIAAQENQIAPEAVDCSQRKTVYVALIQVHLDTLDDVGAIRYDDREKTVTGTDTTALLADHIRRLTAACDNLEVSNAR